MHWADVIAEKLLRSGKKHVISSGITPSGPIHLGSMREILTADAIVKAVNEDFGNRDPVMSAVTEVASVIGPMEHAKKNLRKWMKTEKRKAAIAPCLSGL